MGKPSESIESYDKALAIDPNHVFALINKGYALNILGQYLEAIRYYDKALAIDPNNTIASSGKRLSSDNLRPQAVSQTNQTETWINWTNPKTGLVYQVLSTGDYCLDMNGDSICDVTFTNGTMVFDERNIDQPTPPADQIYPLNQSREELEKLILETGGNTTTELIWECTQPKYSMCHSSV